LDQSDGLFFCPQENLGNSSAINIWKVVKNIYICLVLAMGNTINNYITNSNQNTNSNENLNENTNEINFIGALGILIISFGKFFLQPKIFFWIPNFKN